MSDKVSGAFIASLRDFLISQFDPVSLNRLVSDLPSKNLLVPHLTFPTSRWTMSSEVVSLSIEHGQLGDLKKALLDQRAPLRAVIEEIWSLPAPEPTAPVVPARRTLSPAVPEPPPYFEERPEHGQIRAALRARRPLVGITGLPGSGKTTAAIAALDDEVRAAFSAVCWLDSDSSTPLQPSDARAKLARQLGGTSAPDKPPSRDELAQLAAEVIGDGHL